MTVRTIRPGEPGLRVEPSISRFGSIDVELFHSTPDLRLDEHGHDSLHYCLPIRGCFYETEGKGEVLLSRGWLRASPPGDRHRIRFGPEVAECLLIFQPLAFRDDRRPTPMSRRFRPSNRGPMLARSILEEMKDPDLVSPLVVEGAVLELSALAQRSPHADKHPPSWLSKVRDLLEESVSEPPTLDRLASVGRVHRSQLVRAFRAHFGCSVGAFLRRQRLTAALRQISASDTPLSRIAADCGFSDQSHMTRQVHAATGQTPGEVRKTRRS